MQRVLPLPNTGQPRPLCSAPLLLLVCLTLTQETLDPGHTHLTMNTYRLLPSIEFRH